MHNLQTVQPMYEREYEEYEREDVAELIEHYEQMVKDDSNYFFEETSFDQLIEYYEEKADYKRAMDVVDRALEQHPYAANFMIKKAHLLFEQKRVDEAMGLLDKAEAMDSSDVSIYLLRCDIFTWQGKYNKALNTIQAAMEIADRDERSDLYLELADVYEEWEKYDEVFDCLVRSLELDPENEEALNRVWFCVEFTEKFEESIKFHKAFIDEHPYSYLAWFNLAHAYAGLDLYEKAVEAFEFVIAINEEYEYAYKDCGEVLFRMEKYEDAAEYLLRASVISKPYKELYYSLGECFERMLNFNRARYYYRKATNLDPYFADAFHKIGYCYEEEERYDAAITAYERAYRLEKNNSDYVVSLGFVFYNIDQFDKSIEFFRRAVEMEGEVSENWEMLSRAYFEASEYREALNVLEKAILLFDGSANFFFMKAAYYYQIGNRNESLVNLERALLQDFDSHDLMWEITPYMEHDDTVANLIEQYRK